MVDLRKQTTSDGCCTVFHGSGLIVSGLNEATADYLITRLKGPAAVPAESGRNVGGRARAPIGAKRRPVASRSKP